MRKFWDSYVVAAIFVLMVVTLFFVKEARAQATWTQCAPEGGACTLAVQKLVRYGQPWVPAPNGSWTATRTIVGTFACTNAYFGGDPSPGTGKRCETMDVPVTPPPLPPSGMLPPLTSGENYVVDWTKPTTNTDGTPIGTITKTEIHASTSQDFATYYSWTQNDPAATSVSIVNGPTGTVYWRARVYVGTAMSDFSATAISERQWVAQKKPACWPKPFGCGTWPKAAQNADGFAIYWQETVDGVPRHSGFVGTWASLEPDWMKQLSDAIATGSFNALWDSKVNGPSQASKYVTVQPLWLALRDANPLPTVSAPIYVVKPNGLFPSRPAYPIVNGSRSSTAKGSVAIKNNGGVAQPCDCTAFSAGSDPNRYCAVTGLDDYKTSVVDALGPSAAVCTKAP